MDSVHEIDPFGGTADNWTPAPKGTHCDFCGKPLSEKEQWWHAACAELEQARDELELEYAQRGE